MSWRTIAILVFGLSLGALARDGYVAYKQPAYERSRPKRAPRRLLPREITLEQLSKNELSSFSPLPTVYQGRFMPPERQHVELGRKFFYDKRFSRNHDISCNSCHPLLKYGMDNRGVSLGHVGQTGTRNAPTVYNAAGNGAQFWDGRAANVEEQAVMPVMDPFEMAMSEQRVLQTIRTIPEYVSELEALFPEDSDPVSLKNFGKVVGAFERVLVTPSRWDDFLGGKEDALTQREKRGFMMFYQLGCVSCHAGRLVGGGHFEMLGQAQPWPNQTDLGRSQLGNAGGTTTPMFKVASLRNVAMTAPYFHDASSDTLEDAVRRMAAHQLGIKLNTAQAQLVVEWLNTLTGDLPMHEIFEPDLPEGTDKVPAPTRDGY